jgi:radical SAM superfamily enzyme YgiQ (UPF0313 family)
MSVVSAALSASGHVVQQYDYQTQGSSYDDLVAELKAFNPEYVALSIRNIDSVNSLDPELGWQMVHYRKIVSLVRSVARAPIICGGGGFSIMPEAILDFIGADYGIQGPGEAAIILLIEALNHGERPERIQYVQETVRANTQQFGALIDAKILKYYYESSGIIGIQTKRGCSFKCTYCTYPAIEGNTFRARPEIQVVDEIERIRDTHQVHDFFFTDSIFNDPSGHYLRLIDELLRRDLKIRWAAFFTPRTQDLNKLSLLKASGLYGVELGTDAASDTTLKGMHKGFRFEQVHAFNEACVLNEIPCAHYIIFGGPGETAETLEEGIQNIEALRHCVVFAFSDIRIFPGTLLAQQAVREGILKADQLLLEPIYYHSPQIDREWMNARLTEAFRGRRDRIFPPDKGLEMIAVMKKFGIRGLAWNHLIKFPKRNPPT